VFSKNATGIELMRFDGVNDARPARAIPLDPANGQRSWLM
jgi:hypothetical protein